MRLIFVVNSLIVGGAEIHTVALAEALVRRGHYSVIVNLRDETRLPLGQPSLVRAGRGNGILDVGAMAALAKIIDEIVPDIVIGVNLRPGMYSHVARAIAKHRFRTCYINHSTILFRSRDKFFDYIFSHMFPSNDLLVYVSQNQRSYWEGKGVTARNIATVHNGIDGQRFSPDARLRDREAMRMQLGFMEEDLVLGLSAAFRPEKNHQQAVDALVALRNQEIPAKLLCVGDGPTRPVVEGYVEQAGMTSHVVFAGRQADVVPFLAAFDIGLLTSTAVETFSLAALEFMALGVPAVLSDIGGASEMVAEGVNGYLFPANDIDKLVASLKKLANPAHRNELGVAAARRVHVEFSHDRMVDTYEELFSELLT